MNFLLLRAESGKNEIPIPDSISYPPLGLLYIGSALENFGHKVKIIDFAMEKITREKLKNSILTSDAIGIHLYTYSYKNVAKLSQLIREIDTTIPLIIGGPHCIFNQNLSLLDVPSADICVIGEGEQTIIEIAEVIEGKKNFSEVHGIYYKENNKIKAGKPIKIIDDLDSLKFPARHLVDKYNYRGSNLEIFRPRFTSMITSRGCPYKCRFCATRYSNLIDGYYYRERSAENVVDEILKINKTFNSVLIEDEHFLTNSKRSHLIMDKIIDAGIDLDLLILGARVDSADRSLYNKMKKAGVKYIGFGIESGNQEVLDYYNKKTTLNQIRKTVQLAQEIGFITHGTFILGAPIEYKKDIKKTIKFACSLPLNSVNFSVLAYQKGSDLWLEAVKNKKINRDEYVILADSNRDLGNLTKETLMKYCKKAHNKFYLRPLYLFNIIKNLFIKKNFKYKKIEVDITYFFDKLKYPSRRRY